ncbi:MAG TPA: DUF881 domain-containing protein [Ornithinibacter sp.]|nr:DUF881 domain-containing protein [Ornithinibacter sp.]
MTRPGPAEPTGRRPDASMTLLTTMLERPLDPGYAAAADRRTAVGMPRATSLRSPRLAVACVLIGLMVGVAAHNLTAPDTPRSQARDDLIEQIEARRAQVDDLTARASGLQAEVTGLESAQLGGDELAVRSRDLAATVGAVPLQGPGFTLTLDDAPGSGADESSETGADEAALGRVLAKDLQFVTNALWESGAEAVSINGKRLTSTSSIRFAGSAIIVDYRPLTRPYVITALGDPKRFPATFADGDGGTYLSTLRSTYGVRVDTEVKDELTVPAAVGLTTRYATTGDTEDASPSPTPTTERSPS